MLQVAQNHCRYLLPNGGSGPSQAQVQKIMTEAIRVDPHAPQTSDKLHRCEALVHFRRSNNMMRR